MARPIHDPVEAVKARFSQSFVARIPFIGARFYGAEFSDEQIEEALGPSPLSLHAQKRLTAPDAPRFKANPGLLIDRA